ALAREHPEIGEHLAKLVFAGTRVRRVDHVAAALGEAGTRPELVDNEDHLVIFEDQIARAPDGVRSTELLARLHDADACGARGRRLVRLALGPVGPTGGGGRRGADRADGPL